MSSQLWEYHLPWPSSAADAGGMSAPAALSCLALLGGFDAVVDLLPGLVVVGAEMRFADVVIGWVCHFLLIVSELAVAEHGGSAPCRLRGVFVG